MYCAACHDTVSIYEGTADVSVRMAAAYTCLLVDTDGRKSGFCIMGKPCVCEKQQERQGG